MTAFGLRSRHLNDPRKILAEISQAAESGDPYGLILVDEDFRDGSVPALLERLHEQTTFQETRVLLLSSAWSAARREHELIVDGCLHKPVSQSQLLEAILRTVTGRQRETIRFRPARQRSLAVRKILIAEDNDINQIVTTKVLASAGYECVVAEYGRKALEALSRATYDLVLMDCQMPEMDGFEATKQFRERERATTGQPQPLPIIALTANAMGGDRERCLDAGMTDDLSKPIDPLKLIDLIESYLDEAKAT